MNQKSDYNNILKKVENIATKENINTKLLLNNYLICKDIDKAVDDTKNGVMLKIIYNNEEYFIGDFCRRFHLELTTFKKNLLFSSTLKDAINITKNNTHKTFFIDLGSGKKEYTFKQISIEEDCSTYYLYKYYNQTNDIKKAIALAKNNKITKVLFEDEDGVNEYSITSLAKKYNLSPQSLQNNYYKYNGDIYLAFSKALELKNSFIPKRSILYDDGSGEKEYSVLSLSKKLGIPRSSLTHNLNKYKNVDDAINHTLNNKKETKVFYLKNDSTPYSLNCLSKKYHITKKRLEKLLNTMSIDEAIIEAIASRPNIIYYDFGYGEEQTSINKVALYYKFDRTDLQRLYNQTNDIYDAVELMINKSRPRRTIKFFIDGKEKIFNNSKEFTEYFNIPYQSFINHMRIDNNLNLTVDSIMNRSLNFNMKYGQLKILYDIRKNNNDIDLIKKAKLSYEEIKKLLLLDLNYDNNNLIVDNESNVYKRRVLLKNICLNWDSTNKVSLIKENNLTTDEVLFIQKYNDTALEIYSKVYEKSNVKIK